MDVHRSPPEPALSKAEWVGMTMEERGGVSVAGILHKGIGRSTLCGYAGFARLAIVGLLVPRFQI